MQYPERFSTLPENPFARLRALLDGVEPASPAVSDGQDGDPIAPPIASPIAMTIGEPRHTPPAFINQVIAEHGDKWNRYPPNNGAPHLRSAISNYLDRRYNLAEEYRDPMKNILVSSGSREGLFNAVIATCPEEKNGQRPAVLIPNPFYQCYAAAVIAAGGEPVYVPADASNGHLPDFASLPAALLDRTALVFLCSPANPQGATADMAYWQNLLGLAEKHDFIVLADECYGEIYRFKAPVGALEAMQASNSDPERVIAFHSLSKRSNLAGMRSGFSVAGPKTSARIGLLRGLASPTMPMPIEFASAAAWEDDAHVAENRRLYAHKFLIADELLGDLPGYYSPPAGFFLWLDVGNGEKAALDLWRDYAVRVLPGSYLSRETPAELGGGNPGAAYIRLALVDDADTVRTALAAIRRYITSSKAG